MARHFIAASSQSLVNVSAVPVAAVPLTLACWAKPSGASTNRILVALDGGAVNGWFLLWLNSGAAPSGAVEAYQYDGATVGEADTTVAAAPGQWNHCCAVFTTNSSRTAYLNGGSPGSNTTAVTTPTLSRTVVGEIEVGGVHADFMNGDLAEVAIWNVALTTTEIAHLAAGVKPSVIRPAALVFYAPLLGTTSPEPDLIAARNLTVTGATQITHPLMLSTVPNPTDVIIFIAGVLVTPLTAFDLNGGLTITDTLAIRPNTAAVTFLTTVPGEGNDIQIGLGGIAAPYLMFGGEIQGVDLSYLGPSFPIYPATLIDYSFQLNKRRPFGSWVNTSATTIALAIAAGYASGFSTNNIAPSLPAVTIAFDGSQDFLTCLGALATAIAGVNGTSGARVDYGRDLYLFLTDPTLPPAAVTSAHPPLNDPSPMTVTTDLSQVRTRIYGKGVGTTIPTVVAASETILPVSDSNLFSPVGGSAITSVTSGGKQWQVIAYTSAVVASASPIVAPTIAPAGGAGLSAGVYQGAYTFVTAAGETTPSPVATFTAGGSVAAPAAPTTSIDASGGSLVPGGSYHVKIGFALDYLGPPTLCSLPSAATAFTAGAGGNAFITWTAPTDPRVIGVAVYRTTNGGAVYYFSGNFPFANPYGQFYSIQGLSDATLVGQPTAPIADTSITEQATVAGISVGPVGTTSRKYYRTVAGGSQLKLQQTIANNTATTGVTDATADGALGANAPVSDTSGLPGLLPSTTTNGATAVAAVTLVTVSAAFLPTGGGWVQVGNQYLRYTGIAGQTLTGIPASGIGSVTSAIATGTLVVLVPALMGVTGLTVGPAPGSAVSIWVQRDNSAAQTALGLLELDQNGVATDGIREGVHFDASLGLLPLTAACDADLALFDAATVTVDYYIRDPASRSGKRVFIDLPAPIGVTGTFTIQTVTSTFDAPALNPLAHITASSVQFTVMDLLRRALIAV